MLGRVVPAPAGKDVSRSNPYRPYQTSSLTRFYVHVQPDIIARFEMPCQLLPARHLAHLPTVLIGGLYQHLPALPSHSINRPVVFLLPTAPILQVPDLADWFWRRHIGVVTREPEQEPSHWSNGLRRRQVAQRAVGVDPWRERNERIVGLGKIGEARDVGGNVLAAQFRTRIVRRQVGDIEETVNVTAGGGMVGGEGAQVEGVYVVVRDGGVGDAGQGTVVGVLEIAVGG